MYNNQLTNATNKIMTPWNIIKAEMNRSKGPLNTITNNSLNSPEAYNRFFYLYLKILLMVLEAKAIKVLILLKT